MIKKGKKKKEKRKKIAKQELILLLTFIGLIILVVALGIYALNIEKFANKNKTADLTIPILEKQSQGELSIEISDMTKGEKKEYILAVSNYKEKNILSNDLTYDIELMQADCATVKVYKNNSTNNLLEESQSLIEDNKLKAKKKTEDVYKIIIEAKTTPKSNEKITIKINS